MLEQKFAELYKAYYPKAFAFIYSLTNSKVITDDVIQDTFLKVYTNLESIRNTETMSVWINKIAYNTLLDFYKKRANKEIVTDNETLATNLIELSDIQKQLEQKVMSECVNDKINLVPENYRGPIFLDMHGFSNMEIAEILGCTLENAKIRLHRGKKKLKEVLGNQCSFYLDERSVLC